LLEIKTPTYPDESGITTSPKGGTLSWNPSLGGSYSQS
jgi:hypothetical protein